MIPRILLSTAYWNGEGLVPGNPAGERNGDMRLVLVAWYRNNEFTEKEPEEYSVHLQSRPGDLFAGRYTKGAIAALQLFIRRFDEEVPFRAWTIGFGPGEGVLGVA